MNVPMMADNPFPIISTLCSPKSVHIALHSTKINKTYVYHIVRNDNNHNWSVFHINEKSRIWIGGYDVDFNFFPTHPENEKPPDYLYIRMFRSLLKRLQAQDVPKTLRFYKNPYCVKCGQLLYTKESIERGYGPVCWASENKTNKKEAIMQKDKKVEQLRMEFVPEQKSEVRLRVEKELEELNTRLEKLRAFIKSEKFSQMRGVQKFALLDQQNAMSLYKSALQRRLINWED